MSLTDLNEHSMHGGSETRYTTRYNGKHCRIIVNWERQTIKIECDPIKRLNLSLSEYDASYSKTFAEWVYAKISSEIHSSYKEK